MKIFQFIYYLFIFTLNHITNDFSLYDVSDYSVVYIVGHTDYKHT